MFPDDNSLFLVVQDITLSAKNVNHDQTQLKKWAFQWKISFNLDSHKPAQEVVFSRKNNKRNHPSLNFNNMVVLQAISHKHVGMIVDVKPDFQERIKEKRIGFSNIIGLLRKLQKY